ncbi:antibiotic biosynthesis monooxygenase [Halioglobus japonicus]|uniref:Antibiotic biosynthesis monooxygenase n=1 Tax=Halioglobus japonicus TaxID=930805 RepID=A0AAP8MDI3_9GAMM|nr:MULTISPECIES: antibiotic biosynthesis monooxygenase [Halioglobus]AQA17864.1 antibiotic biosynthesis monooxygenase [Halioglobus japonicus]KZX57172.1 antibiotic biosynthesis monooxygenase [Halioglobus sp. HI00S01]PLW85826.1 antibiotic biosynthesis monooxygenase [Halioglobus japonicus]
MFAVIFRATIKALDQEYVDTAETLRQRALSEFGCVEFKAWTEGDSEVAISYWKSEADILAWKQDAMHQRAQAAGAARWYSSYSVEVVEVVRRYEKSLYQ